MALLGFQKRFVPAIQHGDKQHTIRGHRPDIRVGVRLDLYEAPRTKNMRLIFRVPCVALESIQIVLADAADEVYLPQRVAVCVSGVWLDRWEREELAKRDGFSDFTDMCGFWDIHRQLPFDRVMILWRFDQRRMGKS